MTTFARTFNCVGTVRMVSAKFAYVLTPKGEVFCPLAAAVPPEEVVPDLRARYAVGDSVRVDAVPQDAKNGCAFRAKRMRLIKSQQSNGDVLASGEPSTSTGVTCTCNVGYVDSSYIVADSIEFGGIFVPRSIFGVFEKDFSDLQPGDVLSLTIRPQVERNNCKWIALAIHQATKSIQDSNSVISGSGIVFHVDSMTAIVDSLAYGQVVCPVINWQGGDMGTNATGLDEILRIGDQVAFEAIFRDGVRRAIRWSFLNNLKKTPVTRLESYTQTMPTLQDYAIRLLRPQLEQMKETKPLVKVLLQSLNDTENA